MAKRMKTAAQATEKWARKMGQAAQDYREGVESVSESPTMAAAMAQDKYLMGVQQAAQDGKFRRGLEAVSLDEWKRKTVEKGAARLADGSQQAIPKVAATMNQLMDNIAQVKAEVDRMPSNTFEERQARMMAFSRGMHDRPIK